MNRMEQARHVKPGRVVLPTDRLTESIIGCAMRVHSELGPGFLEKVYENALFIVLEEAGHQVMQQAPAPIEFHGRVIGDYVADLFVDGQVIVELKTVRTLDDIHIAKCKNYLKATGLDVCLLVNFANPSLEFKRILHLFKSDPSA